MVQVARHLPDPVDSFLLAKRVVICDRDAKFTEQFKKTIETFGVKVVVAPDQAPTCNAHADHLVRAIKERCLNRMIVFGGRTLLRYLREFTAHDHAECNHQDVGNEQIDGGKLPGIGAVECQQRLGGLLEYHRPAA